MLHVAPAILSVFLVFYLGSMATQPQTIPEFDFRDKVGHFLAFAFVQFTHYRAVRFLLPERSVRFALTAAVITATSVGAGLELWQLTLPHRSAEWADLLADFLGAALMGAALGWGGRGTR